MNILIILTNKIVSTMCVIQRYNTYYALSLIIWVILSGFTLKSRVLQISSMILCVPALILTYFSLYYTNIPQNKNLPNFNNLQFQNNLGFQTNSHLWIEVIILNAMIALNFLYFK
jgi:hypothetical protein